MTRKIYFFIGTTAELLKLFPVIREMEKRKIPFKMISSGQTEIKFNEVSRWIKKTVPDIILPGKSNESSTLLFLIWTIRTLFTAPFYLFKEFHGSDKPIYFIVHGDTVSSAIGAVISKLFRLKLVHIESGLRSFDYFEPFPEELCRVLVSKLADIHFCPNKWALDNLPPKEYRKVNTLQNTLIESYWLARRSEKIINDRLRLKNGKYFVLISHRQEHVVFGKSENKELINFVLNHFDKKLTCVFVTHETTIIFLKSVRFKLRFWQNKNVKFIPRLKYIDFMNLLDKAEFLVTDGGSNQEEAYYMGLPCLLLRSNTERIEGLGGNVVLAEGNRRLIKSFLNKYHNYRRLKIRFKVRPSKIIVDYLIKD